MGKLKLIKTTVKRHVANEEVGRYPTCQTPRFEDNTRKGGPKSDLPLAYSLYPAVF
jgi:hypothetical protein